MSVFVSHTFLVFLLAAIISLLFGHMARGWGSDPDTDCDCDRGKTKSTPSLG